MPMNEREGYRNYPLSKKYKGSATVEALFIMPVAFLFVLAIAWFMDIYRIHSEIGAAVYDSGSGMVEYSYPYLEAGKSGDEDSGLLSGLLGEAVISRAVVYANIEETNAFDEIEDLICTVNYEESDNSLTVEAHYSVDPPVSLEWLDGIRLTNTFYSKLYAGYVNSSEEETSELIYVTKDSEVYHTSCNCRALKTTVEAVSAGEVNGKRNKNGAKYYPCSFCKNEEQGSMVYITPYGTKYHKSRSCSSLNTTIYTIKKSEKGDRRKCYFCE